MFKIISDGVDGKGFDGLKRHSFKRYGNALKSVLDLANELGVEVDIDRKSGNYTDVVMSDGWIYTILKD